MSEALTSEGVGRLARRPGPDSAAAAVTSAGPRSIPRIGVLLAAGRSERFHPMTGGGSKALVRLGGLPLVERAVRSLLALGLEEVIVVVGYRASPVDAVVGRIAPGRVRAVYAERWEAGFLDWLAMMRDAVSMQAVEHWLPSPMRFVPLPKGRQRASAMGVTATLSVSHSAANPDTAATALALLAERVSQSVVPSARRLSTDAIQRLAPHYTADQAQILADSLADSRALVTGDLQRSAQLRTALWTSLVVPIQAGGTRPLDEKIESANRAIQDILSRP